MYGRGGNAVGCTLVSRGGKAVGCAEGVLRQLDARLHTSAQFICFQ
jgi:hypothetical protein